MNFPASVPLLDLGAQQEEIAAEVEIGMKEVFARATFIGGPQVAEFEDAYGKFPGTQHRVGVANGTDALELALRACGAGHGGEVILPANTFIATSRAHWAMPPAPASTRARNWGLPVTLAPSRRMIPTSRPTCARWGTMAAPSGTTTEPSE